MQVFHDWKKKRWVFNSLSCPGMHLAGVQLHLFGLGTAEITRGSCAEIWPVRKPWRSTTLGRRMCPTFCNRWTRTGMGDFNIRGSKGLYMTFLWVQQSHWLLHEENDATCCWLKMQDVIKLKDEMSTKLDIKALFFLRERPFPKSTTEESGWTDELMNHDTFVKEVLGQPICWKSFVHFTMWVGSCNLQPQFVVIGYFQLTFYPQ